MKKTEVLNVRLPKELLNELDDIIQKRNFTTRSEAIRFYLREFTQENKVEVQKQK